MTRWITAAHDLCCGRLLFSFLVVLFLSVEECLSIKCYECTAVPPSIYSNKTEKLCSKFDYSEKYIRDCPYSTMCLKKYYEYPLRNGDLIMSEERDCAPQKYEYQELTNKKWTLKARIEEAYPEGCQYMTDKLVSPNTMYCYCRDSLCNDATPLKPTTLAYHTDAIAVIVVFNVIKYIQSL